MKVPFTPDSKGFFSLNMNKPPYLEKLNSKEWQDKAHKIKTRDNLKCQAFNCQTPNAHLQVHHLDYIGNTEPWDYPDEMLISLCCECHKNEQLRFKFEQSLFTALKLKGFLACDILAFTTLIHHDEKFLTSLLRVIRQKENG